MHPILFKLGRDSHSYGFLMAPASPSPLVPLPSGRREGLDATRLIDAAFYIMIVSLVGAKLILFIATSLIT